MYFVKLLMYIGAIVLNFLLLNISAFNLQHKHLARVLLWSLDRILDLCNSPGLQVKWKPGRFTSSTSPQAAHAGGTSNSAVMLACAAGEAGETRRQLRV